MRRGNYLFVRFGPNQRGEFEFSCIEVSLAMCEKNAKNNNLPVWEETEIQFAKMLKENSLNKNSETLWASFGERPAVRCQCHCERRQTSEWCDPGTTRSKVRREPPEYHAHYTLSLNGLCLIGKQVGKYIKAFEECPKKFHWKCGFTSTYHCTGGFLSCESEAEKFEPFLRSIGAKRIAKVGWQTARILFIAFVLVKRNLGGYASLGHLWQQNVDNLQTWNTKLGWLYNYLFLHEKATELVAVSCKCVFLFAES